MFFKKFAWCLAVPIYAHIGIFGGSVHTKINLHIHTQNRHHRPLLHTTHRSIHHHARRRSIRISFKHLPVDILVMVEDNLDIHALRFINAVAGDVLESFQFTLLCYWFATHETLYSVIHFTHSSMFCTARIRPIATSLEQLYNLATHIGHTASLLLIHSISSLCSRHTILILPSPTNWKVCSSSG